jgi:viroplasmin and RNaseH domain-containing protein
MRWYVVFRGRKPGIYNDWGICNIQVDGFKGATYKGCRSRQEAEEAFRAYVNRADDMPGAHYMVNPPTTPPCVSCRIKNYMIEFQIVIMAVSLYCLFK